MINLDFFWVITNIVGGSNLPRTYQDINFILSKKIKVIISLAYGNHVSTLLEKIPIQHFILNVKDFGIPTHEQVKSFYEIISKSRENNLPILIHCFAGCGRTGLFLTLYLMLTQNHEYNDALSNIRKIRPCAVESKSQLDYLKNFKREKYIRNKIKLNEFF